MMKKRDISIDLLRAVCIFFIILAHVDAPVTITMIREFDVVTLVFISALCMTRCNSKTEYLQMCKGRVKRLLFPTLILITVVIVVADLVCVLFGKTVLFGAKSVILSYTLLDGIGYVWIVRIFLIIGFLNPLIWKIADKLRMDFILIMGIIACILCELIYTNMPESRSLYILIYYYVLYTLPYLFIAILGIKFKNEPNSRSYAILGCVGMALFIIYRIIKVSSEGEKFFSMTKHPPLLDYVFYGLAITAFMMLIGKKMVPKLGRTATNVVVFLSKHSFTIYFAHIYLIEAHELIHYIFDTSCTMNWFIYYLLLVICSLVLVIIYEKGAKLWRAKVRKA